MNGYQSVFKRVEKKYLLDEGQYAALRQRMGDFLEPDRFAVSAVCNIYFDTPDRRLIRASLEKPAYKEKLRVRSYGTPREGGEVFVELKKKYKGVVYKRRMDMALEQAREYLSASGKRPECPRGKEQIFGEIDWFLRYYGTLEPAVYLSYDRLAFSGREDPELRITLDNRILYRTEALDLCAGAWGTELLRPGQRLMEIKAPGAMPLWLCHALCELEIYPVSFSKYGRAYQQIVGREGGVNCA